MQRRYRAPLALTAALALLGGVAAATESNEVREKKAIDAMQSANAMSVRNGVYRQVRDGLLTGQGSVKVKADAWGAVAQQWIAGWMGVLGLVELRDDVPYAAFEAALTTQLEAQATRLATLIDMAARLKAQGDQAFAELGAVPGPPVSRYPEVVPYIPVINGLAARESDLAAALTGMAMMPDAKIAAIQDLDTRARVAVVARLRAALVARGRYPLEQTIAAVQQLLNVEKIVDPILIGAAQIENELDRYALNFQIFHMLDGIVVGRQKCAAGRAALSGVTGAARYVTAARARLEQLCTAMENHYQSLTTLGVGNADLVAAYIENEKPALRTVCQTVAMPPVNCEKLATVAALQPEDYAAMTDAYLKFVEYGWADNLAAAKRKGATP